MCFKKETALRIKIGSVAYAVIVGLTGCMTANQQAFDPSNGKPYLQGKQIRIDQHFPAFKKKK